MAEYPISQGIKAFTEGLERGKRLKKARQKLSQMGLPEEIVGDITYGDIQENPELASLIKARIAMQKPETLYPLITEQGLATIGSKTGRVIPANVSGEVYRPGIKPKEQEDLLSPLDAQRLGVPYGTKKSEVKEQGIFPMAQTTRTRLADIEGSKSIINQIYDDFKKLNPPKTAGELAGKGTYQKLTSNFSSSEAGQYLASQQQFLTMMARSFGERGVVTDQDTLRQLLALPKLGPFGDTAKSAEEKRQRSLSVLNKITQAFQSGLTGKKFSDFIGLEKTESYPHAATSTLSNEELLRQLKQ